MPEVDRADLLRLKHELLAVSSTMLLWYPACILLNVYPLAPYFCGVESCRKTREFYITERLQAAYPGLLIAGIKALDSRCLHFLVVVQSAEDLSILLPAPLARCRVPALPCMGGHAVLRSFAFLSFQSAIGWNSSHIFDISHIARSPLGDVMIATTSRPDSFSFSGDYFNILMIIAMVGRKGRHGIAFDHDIYALQRSCWRYLHCVSMLLVKHVVFQKNLEYSQYM